MKKSILVFMSLLMMTGLIFTGHVEATPENESFWIGMNDESYFGPDTQYSQTLSFLDQMDKGMGEIFRQKGFQIATDSKGFPHVSWITSFGGMMNIESDLMYIRWDGKNWVCIDGSIFNLTMDSFEGNPANISKNGVTSIHSFVLDKNDNPHFSWVQRLGDFEAVVYAFWDGEKLANVDDSEYQSLTKPDKKNTAIVATCPLEMEKYFSLPTLKLDSSGHPNITWKLLERIRDSVTNSLCYLRWDGERWVTILNDPVDGGNYDNAQFYSPGGTIYDYRFMLENNFHPTFFVDNGKMNLEFLKFKDGVWITAKGEEVDNDEPEKIKIFTELSGLNVSSYVIHLDENAIPHIFYQNDIPGNGYEDDKAELYYQSWELDPSLLFTGVSEGGIEIGHSKIQIDSNGFPHITFTLAKKYPRDADVFYVKFDGVNWVGIDEARTDNNLSFDNSTCISQIESEKRSILSDFLLDGNDAPYLITEMLHHYPESEIPEDGWTKNLVYFIRGNEELIQEIRCKTRITQMWIDKKDFVSDGKEYEFEVAPQIIDDSTYVPLRALGDVLDCKTEWVGSERKVIYTYNNKCSSTITRLEIWISSTKSKVNGTDSEIEKPPVIRNDRTLVPLRAITETLGAKVSWDARDMKIEITIN